MIDFSDHKDVMAARATAQEIEHDRREQMRECLNFVTKKDGQWEDGIYAKFEQYGRPRYTFDITGTIVNKYYGEMTQNDFNIRVTPMGSGSSKDTAKLFAGLIKNTESISRATNVYSMAARMEMIAGFDCIRIDQDYADPDSFDQDLFIRHITDSLNRVWFLGNYQERTCEDADGVIVEHLISVEEYEERFGAEDDAVQSIGDTQCRNSYYYKREGVRVGELIYKEKQNVTLYQLPDGTVMSEDDYKAIGVKVEGVKSKKKESQKICVRWFDGNKFLTKSEDTVFDFLPVVPVMPNFLIVEDKPITRGVVEPLMDWQRVRNYTGSAYVEETALAPKDVIMMTREQLAGNEKDAGRLSVAGRPILTYTHIDGQIQPFKPGAYQSNNGLASMFQLSEQGIQSSAGMFAAGLGDNPALQSGVAIERLDNNSNLGSIEYYKALEVTLGHLGKVLVNAYPKIYDTERERRIFNDDGTFELITVNQRGPDGEVINDLSKGIYDVYCDIGKAFRNRQEETAEQIVKLGQVDPIFVSENQDILLSSLDSPGMDQAAERARARLMKAGAIPESQWTDDEKEAAMMEAQAAAQNPPPEDPMMIAAKAEDKKADAALAAQEMKAIQLQQAQQKLDFDQQKQQIELISNGQKDQMQLQKDTMDMLAQMANILKTIGESSEKDVTLTPDAQKAYDKQAQNVVNVQEKL
jgi:hypothetical protein